MVLPFLLPFALRAEEERPAAFGTFLSPDTEITTGIFPVYRQGDKVYLEIKKAALEREWAVSAQIDRGFGLRNRLLPSIGAFRLKLEQGKRLGIYLARREERTSGKGTVDSSMLAASGLREADFYWNIVAERSDGEGYVVDFTEYVRKGGELFSCEYKKLREEREEAFELLKIVPEKNGVCFRMKRFFKYMPENKGMEMMLESGYLPLELSLGIRLLPEKETGAETAKAGHKYRTLTYTDYGTDPCGAAREHLAVHWPPENNGKLTLWADAGVPASCWNLLQTAVDEWNRTEAGGEYGLPLVLRRAEDNADAFRPLLVSCDIGGKGAESSCLEHAGDGRILAGRLHIGMQSPREVMKWRVEHAAINPEGKVHLLPEKEAEEAWLKECLTFALKEVMGMDPALIRQKRTAEACFRYARKQTETYRILMRQAEGLLYAKSTAERNKSLYDLYAAVNDLALQQYLAVTEACHTCRNTPLQEQMCRWLYEQLQKEAEEVFLPPCLKRTGSPGQGNSLDTRFAKVWKAFWKKEIWINQGCFVLAESLGKVGGKTLSPERMTVEWACVSALADSQEEEKTEEISDEDEMKVKIYSSLFRARLKENLQRRLKKSKGKEAAFVELLLRKLKK